MTHEEDFRQQVAGNIDALKRDAELQAKSQDWLLRTLPHGYCVQLPLDGWPIIQYPQDMIAMQEILWDVRPDLIIETGIAHGGLLVYYASLCELMGHGEVLGIDIDIRAQSQGDRRTSDVQAHPVAQGSSVAPDIVAEVRAMSQGKENPGCARLEPHARTRARGTGSLCPSGERRELLRRVRHRDRGPAGRAVSGSAMGRRQQSQNRCARVSAKGRAIRNRQGHPGQDPDPPWPRTATCGGSPDLRELTQRTGNAFNDGRWQSDYSCHWRNARRYSCNWRRPFSRVSKDDASSSCISAYAWREP